MSMEARRVENRLEDCFTALQRSCQSNLDQFESQTKSLLEPPAFKRIKEHTNELIREMRASLAAAKKKQVLFIAELPDLLIREEDTQQTQVMQQPILSTVPNIPIKQEEIDLTSEMDDPPQTPLPDAAMQPPLPRPSHRSSRKRKRDERELKEMRPASMAAQSRPTSVFHTPHRRIPPHSSSSSSSSSSSLNPSLSVPSASSRRLSRSTRSSTVSASRSVVRSTGYSNNQPSKKRRRRQSTSVSTVECAPLPDFPPFDWPGFNKKLKRTLKKYNEFLRITGRMGEVRDWFGDARIPTEFKFRCSLKTDRGKPCECAFRTELELERHAHMHHSEPTLRCRFDGCSVKLRRREYLSIHERYARHSSAQAASCSDSSNKKEEKRQLSKEGDTTEDESDAGLSDSSSETY